MTRKKKTTKKPDDADTVVEAEAETVEDAEVLAGDLVRVNDGEPTAAALLRIIDKAVEANQGIEVVERLLAVRRYRREHGEAR